MPATTIDEGKKKNKGLVVLLVVLLILFAGLITGLLLITRPEPQDPRGRAAVNVTQPPQGPVCPTNGATCTWDKISGITKYRYTITDLTTGKVVKTAEIQDNSVSFTPIVDHRYECKVSAVNECGAGPEAKAVNTCRAGPTATPTNTPTPTGTLTPTPTGTLTPTPTGTLTPTPTLTPTTPPDQPTATPTEIVIAQAEEEEEEVTPTVPEAGTSAGVYFMVAAGIILVTLMLVF